MVSRKEAESSNAPKLSANFEISCRKSFSCVPVLAGWCFFYKRWCLSSGSIRSQSLWHVASWSLSSRFQGHFAFWSSWCSGRVCLPCSMCILHAQLGVGKWLIWSWSCVICQQIMGVVISNGLTVTTSTAPATGPVFSAHASACTCSGGDDDYILSKVVSFLQPFQGPLPPPWTEVKLLSLMRNRGKIRIWNTGLTGPETPNQSEITKTGFSVSIISHGSSCSVIWCINI